MKEETKESQYVYLIQPVTYDSRIYEYEGPPGVAGNKEAARRMAKRVIDETKQVLTDYGQDRDVEARWWPWTKTFDTEPETASFELNWKKGGCIMEVEITGVRVQQ